MEPNMTTKVKLCFYEIYNESIRDLLRSNSNNLNIVEDQSKGVTISDISEFTVDGPEAARTLIFEGVERRAMNSTKSNDVSSRSHAIIQLSVSRFDSCVEDKANVLESKFFLVDLAGNEKTFSNYTSLNKRFVEGVNINKSLLTEEEPVRAFQGFQVDSAFEGVTWRQRQNRDDCLCIAR
jgi:hypothetical protein